MGGCLSLPRPRIIMLLQPNVLKHVLEYKVFCDYIHNLPVRFQTLQNLVCADRGQN